MKIKFHRGMKAPVGGRSHEEVVVERKYFEVVDKQGNSWRLMDRDDGIEIMAVETSQGHLTSLAVKPESGNVIVVLPMGLI